MTGSDRLDGQFTRLFSFRPQFILEFGEPPTNFLRRIAFFDNFVILVN